MLVPPPFERNMYKLTYSRAKDKFQQVTVLGDPIGIKDLYWQLTHNYKAQDGTEISNIKISNLDGIDCTLDIISNPHASATYLSTLET